MTRRIRARLRQLWPAINCAGWSVVAALALAWLVLGWWQLIEARAWALALGR